MTETVHRRSNDDVTIGEVNRNVVALQDTVTLFMAEVRSTTLRQDVYRAEQAALLQRVQQLEGDALTAALRADANRRLAVSGLVFPLLVAVLTAVILAGLPA